jgi:hypothetical protein
MRYKNKFTEVKYWVIDSGDFNTIVRETYGVEDYDFMADVECGNPHKQSFYTSDEDFDEYEVNKIKSFTNGGSYNNIAGTLVIDLANKGLIPEGQILISLSY